MKQFQSRIIHNKRISGGLYELSLAWDIAAGRPRPGQFLTLRVSGSSVPLLRRPFAFSGYDDSADVAYIIYQKRGIGTEIMSEMRPRGSVDVIGPLGAPFPIAAGVKKALAVAGGIGVGPVLFLTAALRERRIDTEFVFGCRSEKFVPDCLEFKLAQPRICTDDGSAGFKGNAVQYIESNIPLDSETTVYGCGPEVMLKSLYNHARPSGAMVFVSLESMMACGVGACMGCAVPTSSGYRCVCSDGPVFDAEEIIWEQGEALHILRGIA